MVFPEFERLVVNQITTKHPIWYQLPTPRENHHESKTAACGFADSRWYAISTIMASKARRPYEHDHTCLVLPKIRQVWLILPYLLQVWHIWTILAASLATCAQLGAFLAALFRQRQNDDPTWRISGSAVLAAPFRQRCFSSTKAIKELKPLTQKR